MDSSLDSLSVKDLRLLVLLRDSQSLRSLSRMSGISLAQVSRTLSQLEEIFGQTILHRSAAGVSLTEEGLVLSQKAEGAIKSIESLKQAPTRDSRRTVLNLGSRAFFNHSFCGIFAKLAEKYPKVLLRALDMPPEDLKVAEHKNALDIAIYMGKFDWTRRWQTVDLGIMPWALYANKDHPAHKVTGGLSVENLSELQFVLPSYWMNAEVREGKDGFPLENLTRKVSIEVQNANAAARIAAVSNCVAYVPTLVATEELQLRRLKTQMPLVHQQPLQLAFCEATVPKGYLDALVLELKNSLQNMNAIVS